MVEEEEVVLEEGQEVPELSEEELEKRRVKAALVAFILGILGFLFPGLVGLILSAIALKQCKKAAGVQRKPHAIFVKIAKPLAIIGLVFSIINVVCGVLAVVGGIAVGVYFGLKAAGVIALAL